MDELDTPKPHPPVPEPVTPDQPRPVVPTEEEDEIAKAARLRAQAALEERAVFDKAAAATAHLPAYGAAAAPLRPSDVVEPGETSIAMMFPRPVTLTLSGYRMVRFEEGLQYVPLSLVDNRHLKARGVKLITGNDTRH